MYVTLQGGFILWHVCIAFDFIGVILFLTPSWFCIVAPYGSSQETGDLILEDNKRLIHTMCLCVCVYVCTCVHVYMYVSCCWSGVNNVGKKYVYVREYVSVTSLSHNAGTVKGEEGEVC